MTREIFFLKNRAENEVRRLDHFVGFFLKKKALYEVKASGLQLSFNILNIFR